MWNFVIFNVSSGKSEELMFPLFQKYLNSQVRTNKLVNSVVYHPFPSRLASGIHPYFLNLLGVLFLSRMLVEFSDLYIPPCVEKKIFIYFMVFQLKNALNLCIFTHALVHHSKLRVQFFENLFSQRPRRKGWRKLWLAFLTFSQKIWRWLEALVCLYLHDLFFL